LPKPSFERVLQLVIGIVVDQLLLVAEALI
jgi:hypothetical protein